MNGLFDMDSSGIMKWNSAIVKLPADQQEVLVKCGKDIYLAIYHEKGKRFVYKDGKECEHFFNHINWAAIGPQTGKKH